MQEKNIETLVINKVENQKVYDAMVAANKINNNELYLVGGGESVTGVKGANEITYRTGNVNLTAENVGALSKDTKIPSKTSDLTNDSDYATNASVDTKLEGKADSSHTHDDRYYTESEVDDKLSGKANTSHSHSNATTNTAGFISAADKIKLNGISEGANKTTVDDALSSTSTNPVQNKVINTKLTTMQTDIDSKVDKDGNKVLSTNDFTTALKNNLNSAYTHSTSAHAPSNAERNTIITIKRNGTALTPTNRVVDITVPTKTSDLTNDSDFATNSSVDTKLANKVTVVSGKGLSTEDYTSAEKTKLSGIATGAEVNQNAFSNVVVGKTTVAADSKTDTLTLISGSNVTLTPDATNDTITIAATDTVYTHPSVTKNNTTSTASPAHGKTFTAIDSITTNGTGHVTAVNTKTVTLPADSDTLGKNIVGTATTSTANGAVTGNGVYLNHIEGTGTVKSTHKITGGGATKVTSDANGNITITSTDNNTVYTHPTYTRSDTTSTEAPAHSKTFTAIDSITTNNFGHVTAINTKTVTLPADNNTHYVSSTIVGNTATVKANAAATNGNVYLNHIENNTVKSAHNIVGSGIVTVISDTNGKITIGSNLEEYTADEIQTLWDNA